MELTEFDKGYIAGIIDGEGSICLVRNSSKEYRAPVVTVTSTTKEILFYLKEKCGGTICKKKKYAEHYKDSLAWSLKRNKAIELLELI